MFAAGAGRSLVGRIGSRDGLRFGLGCVALPGLCGGGLRRDLRRGGALQDVHFLAILELVQMFSFAGRSVVHVKFGARRTVGLYGLARAFLYKLLEGVVNILSHQAALLDPALLPAVGTHA